MSIKNKNIAYFFALSLVGCALFSMSASAQAGDDALTKTKTSIDQQPENTSLPLTAYSLGYQLYASGFDVVQIDVSLDTQPTTYGITAVAQTRGLWKTLVPWSNMITAHGRIKQSDAYPQTARYDTVWRDSPQSVSMMFANDGSIETKTQPERKKSTRSEATTEQIKGAIDPVSALVEVILRETQKAQGCQGKIKSFDGRRVYNLILNNKGTENLQQTSYNIFSGPATRCEVTFEPVAGFPKKEKARGFWNAKDNADQRNPLIIWFAKPQGLEQSVPVRVQSDVQLGTIVAHLSEIKKTTSPTTRVSTNPIISE